MDSTLFTLAGYDWNGWMVGGVIALVAIVAGLAMKKK